MTSSARWTAPLADHRELPVLSKPKATKPKGKEKGKHKEQLSPAGQKRKAGGEASPDHSLAPGSMSQAHRWTNAART